MDYKNINLKTLNKQQKDIIRYINQMIIEQQQVFSMQPEELLISRHDFLILAEGDNTQDYKYLTLGSDNIKIYPVK